MSFLTLGGTPYDVEVTSASEQEPTVLGQSDYSFNNTLRSSIRTPKRKWSFRLPLMTRAEFTALKTALPHGTITALNGDVVENVSTNVEVTYGSISYDAHLLTYKRSPTLNLREA